MAPNLYRFDCKSAVICTAMQERGFRYDTGLRHKMRAFLTERESVAVANCHAAAGREFNPNSGKQLARVLLTEMGAPILFRSEATGDPSFDVSAMRGYAAHHNADVRALALAVLELRRLVKIRGTYIDGVHVAPDGRVHPVWQCYGTVSGRWSCQAPNLQNQPRGEHDPTIEIVKGGLRSAYVPADGHKLVYFDASQLEMRIAAYTSGDEAMIAACESSDLHASNAAALWPEVFSLQAYQEAPTPKMKALRSLAKTSAFAICYMAGAGTVHEKLIGEGQRITLRQCEAMLRRLQEAFAGYYAAQERNLATVARTGYATTPLLGRKRWLGHDPSPTHAANYPIQGGAGDLVNLKTHELVERIGKQHPKAHLVAQVHDSLTFEVPAEEADDVAAVCRDTFEAPIPFPGWDGRTREPSFPVDIDILERWH